MIPADYAVVLHPGDVADVLKLDRATATALMASGQVRSVNVGRGKRQHWRTCKAWLDEFCRGQAVGNNPPASAGNDQNAGFAAAITVTTAS